MSAPGASQDAQTSLANAGSEPSAAPTPTFELMVCGWERNPRHCVYLNDYRIAGGKPRGGAQTQSDWTISLKDLEAAIPDLRLVREALQFGLDLYGRSAPDGPWPIERRNQFDALARQALGIAAADTSEGPSAPGMNQKEPSQ